MTNQLLVATRKGLFSFHPAAGTWKIANASFLGDNCTLVMHDKRDGAIYAALDHGHFGSKLHRSEDHGGTWTEIAAPAYPKRPENQPPQIDDMGRTVPDSLKLIWSLTPGSAKQKGRIWCGTIPGALFKSDDRGDSWQLVESLWNHSDRKRWFGGGADWPGIHSIIVDPRNHQRTIVGVSCGGVWITENDGASWTCKAEGMRAEYMPPEKQFDPVIQDPHCVVQCLAEPAKFWAQHHNGIFRSSDDCATWSEIKNVKPSVFGFPVVVHPQRGDTAWFIPGVKDEKRYPVEGKLVVTRTRDGGTSFDILTNGLPQQHAYDVVFRHAMDIDAAGTTLAFGSTTGNLWLSENQGDSWTELSHTLPPVYAVRFTA